MFENPFDRNRVYRETPSTAMRLKLADHGARLLQELEDVEDDDLSEVQHQCTGILGRRTGFWRFASLAYVTNI
jgi:hypothetical protein